MHCRIVYDLNRQYGIGFLASLFPAHVSLKQPFSFESMEVLEAYLDALAASSTPFGVKLERIYHAQWSGYGILGLDVKESATLRALHNRINEELGELLENPSAPHDGESYHFHLTVELGKVEEDFVNKTMRLALRLERWDEAARLQDELASHVSSQREKVAIMRSIKCAIHTTAS